MALVYISLGSNINPGQNIKNAEQALQQVYGELNYSPVYETEAVGFDGDNFYNSVVSFETKDSVQKVAQQLKDIEDQNGRDRTQVKFSSRIIDLDLLLYDDLVLKELNIHIPREEILYHAFVLKPLVDLAPLFIHPIENKTILALWDESGLQQTPINQVNIK